MASRGRPENLRAQTLSRDEAEEDFRRMSFALNKSHVVGMNNIPQEMLCALCNAILKDPWQCKECKNRFHQVCLNKFARETGQCPFQCKKPRFVDIRKEVEKQLNTMEFQCKNRQFGCMATLTYQ